MLFLRRNVYLQASQQVDDFSRKEYHIGEFIEDGFMIWFKTVTTKWSKQNIIIIIVIYVWGKRYVLRGLSGISIDDSIIASLHEVMHLKQHTRDRTGASSGIYKRSVMLQWKVYEQIPTTWSKGTTLDQQHSMLSWCCTLFFHFLTFL